MSLKTSDQTLYEQKMTAWLRSSCCRDILAARNKPQLIQAPCRKSIATKTLQRPQKTIHEIAKENCMNQSLHAGPIQVWGSSSNSTATSNKGRHRRRKNRSQRRGGNHKIHKLKPEYDSTKSSIDELQINHYYRSQRVAKQQGARAISVLRSEKGAPPRVGWM
jgi:hypothetical protein